MTNKTYDLKRGAARSLTVLRQKRDDLLDQMKTHNFNETIFSDLMIKLHDLNRKISAAEGRHNTLVGLMDKQAS